jgi:hypothetical protein
MYIPGTYCPSSAGCCATVDEMMLHALKISTELHTHTSVAVAR